MDVSLGESVAGSRDKSVHKLIVLLSSDPALSEAEVQFVIEQLLILHGVSKCRLNQIIGIPTFVPQSSTTGS